MAYDQIALKLDCPVGTVKTWVHRARLNLMDQLRNRDVIEGQADQKTTHLEATS